MLSARRVGPTGKAYGLDTTEEMRKQAGQAGGPLTSRSEA
ncbi:hypothetical protein [Streptomyces sp. NBC_00316]|nr:hypothetical protein [Streptomyces sp. NBC_00316]